MKTLKDEDSRLRKARWSGLSLVLLLVGCGITPHTFRRLIHPDGVGRARAVANAGSRADDETITALIARLEDADPVVQLTANEELKRLSGQEMRPAFTGQKLFGAAEGL